MNTNTEDDDSTATNTTDTQANDLHHQLEAMVDNRDWDGINDKSKMICILLSNDRLPHKLLTEEDDKPAAKALLLTLVTSGGKDYVTRDSFYLGEDDDDDLEYGTLLHGALKFNSCMEVVSLLIDVVGKEFVLKEDEYDMTSLCHACKYSSSIGVVKKLIDVGGRELVLKEDEYGSTSLHFACGLNASSDVVKELIEVGGGHDFVWEKDFRGYTALHEACINNASIDVVKELIEAGGGRDIVLDEKDEYGWTALHLACGNKASIDVVKELIEVGGGRDFVLEKGINGSTALHSACRFNASIDVLELLIQYGGRDILTQVNNQHETPLQKLLTIEVWYGDDEEEKRAFIEKISLLINKGIELNIGGQYSIGGLFSKNTSQMVNNVIYGKWDVKLLPALEQVLAMPNNHHLPILQALIVNEASRDIIKSAVDNFTHFINTRDSLHKYPIDVAVENDLLWEDGMEQIVEAFSSVKQTTPFNICVKHGVQWGNGTRITLESSAALDILETVDTSTGLYPFMVAAVGGENNGYKYDFDSVFELIKSRPLVVRQFTIDNMY